MPAEENGFQILNLHPKKQNKKFPFVVNIYPNNTEYSPNCVFTEKLK